MAADSFGWNNNAPDVLQLVHGQVDWLSEEVGKISVSRNQFEFSRDVGWPMASRATKPGGELDRGVS
jgi:hypothetical protein